jgi:hypothetical protein
MRSAPRAITGVILFALSLGATSPAEQTPGPAASASVRPDLSGVWRWARPVRWMVPMMRPWADALVRERASTNYKDRPSAYCLPSGLLQFGEPFKIVQTPSLVLVLFENAMPAVRQIFLDGRAHPTPIEPTWTGHAVGRWDGNSLIVDRVGFNAKAWIDAEGHPASEGLRVTERYTRVNAGQLEIEMTFDDPTTYVTPWSVTRRWELAPNDDIFEFICNENNRSAAHLVGE